MKKSIAFYCCTNGYGHFKRVSEVAKNLTDNFKVDIFCSAKQLSNIGPIDNVSYNLTDDNIRWDNILNKDVNTAINTYFDWLEKYGPTVHNYDTVVSDNIAGLLQYRSDTILMGSFLWSDVLLDKLGTNKLTSFDRDLIRTKLPTIITNKYVETQSLKEYPNKFQTGFGCASKMMIISDIKYLVYQNSSLNYLRSYWKCADTIARLPFFGFTNNNSYIDNTAFVARPGVGTITHCVENYIPLVALYSNEDSKEIIELAQIVEDLKIGFKQNVDEPLRLGKFKGLRSNSNYCYTGKLEKDGYKKIADFIKEL